MLDRTIAPAFQQTYDLELLKADINVLPNGISTYTILGGQQEVIKIEIILRAGRWYEDKTGAAHFAANLLSKGTADRTSFDIARIFDLYGAHLEVNPGLDVVSVALYSLTKNLEPVLDLLLDIVVNASYPEKELEQAKAIFLQNLKVNQEKTSFQASKLFRKKLFGEGHPYGKELEETINDLSKADVADHFQKYFKDSFVVISGRVSPQHVDLIQKRFATFPFGLNAKKSFKEFTPSSLRTINEKEGSLQSTVRIGKRFIGRNHPDYPKVLLLNHILGGYFGSRLMKNIREEKGFTYGIYSSIHTLINDNYLVIGADVNKENLEMTFDEIRKELTKLMTEIISIEEVNTARNHFIGSLQSEISTPFSHADKWKNIILYDLPQKYYPSLLSRLQRISPEELRAVAPSYFSPDTFIEVAVG